MDAIVDHPIFRLVSGLLPLSNTFAALNWINILLFLIIAFAIFRISAQRFGPEKNKSFAQFAFPKEIYLHPDSITTYKLYVGNKIFFFLTTYFWTVLVGVGLSEAIESMAGGASAPFAVPAEYTWAAAVGFGVIVFILADFALFYMHFLSHKIPLLWEFHKMHHSSRALTPIADYYLHPAEIISRDIFYAVLYGGSLGFFNALFAADGAEISSLNIFWFTVVMNAFWNFRHTHMAIHFPRSLSRFVVSPAMHQVHHSCAANHWDKNFGLTFSFWDRLFGSFYLPGHGEVMKYGLGDDAASDRYKGLANAYSEPFRAIFRRWRGGKRWRSFLVTEEIVITED